MHLTVGMVFYAFRQKSECFLHLFTLQQYFTLHKQCVLVVGLYRKCFVDISFGFLLNLCLLSFPKLNRCTPTHLRVLRSHLHFSAEYKAIRMGSYCLQSTLCSNHCVGLSHHGQVCFCEFFIAHKSTERPFQSVTINMFCIRARVNQELVRRSLTPCFHMDLNLMKPTLIANFL